MTTIDIDTPHGPVNALLDIPKGQGSLPGVVVIHPPFGATDSDKEAISKRIADAGYIALTPGLFSRGNYLRCVTRVFRDLLTKKGPTLDIILAARDYVTALPESSGAVGIAGFCMGGQFALVMAPKGFGASAPFYPTPLPRNLSETLEGACPIVATFGARDPLGPGAAKRLEKVVASKGITADIKSYSHAGHSFANDIPNQPLMRITGFGYNEAATEDAWARVFGFFGEHLRARTSTET
jgi:carboxymethylenebutenolidase